jgi:outer membrane PBP1 activator LpoA protein
MLKQTVVRLRTAQRQLTPDQKNTVTALENKIKLAEKALKVAKDSLAKWQKGERYTPQKNYVEQEGRSLRGLGAAIANLASNL